MEAGVDGEESDVGDFKNYSSSLTQIPRLCPL